MRRAQKWQLTLWLILAFAGTIESAAAYPREGEVSFTVHVRNYARVDAETLTEAEKIAAGIFLRAGIETRWVDTHIGSDIPSDLWVHILPQEMADRLRLSDSDMGLAPGKGPDRRLVYVFYERVRQLAKRQLFEQTEGIVSTHATVVQILGETMAHELGHILLNLSSHSKTGIMRGDWDLKDLSDVAYGYLLFTQQQAELIRRDVIRRSSAGFALEPLTQFGACSVLIGKNLNSDDAVERGVSGAVHLAHPARTNGREDFVGP
jgi:hypothetical protein